MSPCRLLNNILKDKDGEERKLFFRWRWKVLEFKITIEGDHIISCLGKGHLGNARWLILVGQDCGKIWQTASKYQLQAIVYYKGRRRPPSGETWQTSVPFIVSCAGTVHLLCGILKTRQHFYIPTGGPLPDLWASVLGMWQNTWGSGKGFRTQAHWSRTGCGILFQMIGRCTPPGRCLKLQN